MWGKGPPTSNQESWQDIHLFIAEFPENDTWSEWKAIAETLVKSLEELGLEPAFRIGQSMHHIILSTLDHHRLADEPRVTLEINSKKREVRVAYGRSNLWFKEPLAENTFPAQEALPGIRHYLRRLWGETRNAEPIPKAIESA